MSDQYKQSAKHMESHAESKREQNKQERRLKISASAGNLIRARGTTDFTMQELADAAGVSLATPYNLFGSKNQVILAVLADHLTEFQTKVLRKRCDELDTIFASVSIARSMYAEHEDFYRAIFRQLSDQITENNTIWQQIPTRGHYRDLVQAAIDKGFLREDLNATMLARTLSYIFVSGRLDWISRTASLAQFERQVKWGQALLLQSAATPAFHDRLMQIITDEQNRSVK